MSADNISQHQLMTQPLRKIVDAMVFDGVTPKLGMRKVKAMKRLWRSDSFQRMRTILEEPPIYEGRIRPPDIPLPLEGEDDEIVSERSLGDSLVDKVMKEKDDEVLRRKEEMCIEYQHALDEDLATLQEEADENLKNLLAEAKLQLEISEKGHMDTAIKQKINEMRKRIKCTKKHVTSAMKLMVEDDRKTVTTEIIECLQSEIKIRSKTYAQLLDKSYSFSLRTLDSHLEEKYDEKLRQRERWFCNKFEIAKRRLIVSQKDELKKLNCRLASQYETTLKSSQYRIDTAFLEEIKKLEMAEEEPPEKYSICSLEERMRNKLRDKGWLPPDVDREEEWESMAVELIERFQTFISLALGQSKLNPIDYLLSLDKLKAFKDEIAQKTEKNIIDTQDIKLLRRKKLEVKARAASLIDYLIREVIPSPLPSRTSYFELKFNEPSKSCKPMSISFIPRGYRFSGSVGPADLILYDRKVSGRKSSANLPSIVVSQQIPLMQDRVESKHQSIRLSTKPEPFVNSLDKIEQFVDTVKDNAPLYQLFVNN